jgi:cytochrome c oxidase assembly factor 6
MGWLPSWTSTGLGGAAAAPTEPAGPPKREDRVRCWDSRDIFFACLDKNGIIDSLKEDKKAREVCGAEHLKFEKNCVASWVGYRSSIWLSTLAVTVC